MKICIPVFSQGKNMELALKIQEALVSRKATVEILDVVALDLPLYSMVAEKKFDPLELVKPFKDKLVCDAFVFVAPEYNGNTPPTFSNFLAWVSRSNKEWRDVFNEKNALIATHSAGGGLNVLTSMRLQLAFLGMNVIGRQVHTTLSKQLETATVDAVCGQLLKSI